jgi:predicted thioesterase
MKPGFRVGIKVDIPAKVEKSMRPQFEGRSSHPLYATWAMVYHMEMASRILVMPYLGPGEEAVAAGALVKHLSPARVGAPLHVSCTLARVRGARIYTRLAIYSKNRKIGEGSVLQVVMSRGRLARILAEAL